MYPPPPRHYYDYYRYYDSPVRIPRSLVKFEDGPAKTEEKTGASGEKP